MILLGPNLWPTIVILEDQKLEPTILILDSQKLRPTIIILDKLWLKIVTYYGPKLRPIIARGRLGIPLKIHVAKLLQLFSQQTIYH